MRIFIAEDDPWYANILQHHLDRNPDYEILTFRDTRSLLSHMRERPDVLTLDYSLPDLRADQLIPKIREKYPDLPILIISGQQDVVTTVRLFKLGIYDYIVKDDEARERIWHSLINLKKHLELQSEVKELREEVGRNRVFRSRLIGHSQAMIQLRSMIEKAATTAISVSITGETGTGKELVANAIHDNSKRAKRPFVAVNLAAIPEGLVESELFGHERGAFTGAVSRRIGRFEEAADGTLFLDEVGELPLPVQAKLLRVLQEREFSRVGSGKSVEVKCRIITATYRDLTELVQEGKFRKDLFYRLLGLPIQIAPLRERREDIPLIVDHVLEEFAEENESRPATLTNDALDRLLDYNWPGNVRELKAVAQLAAVLSDGFEINPKDIRFHHGAETGAGLLDREMTLKEYNIAIINHYLDRYQGNVLRVADKLGIGKSTIYRMLKDHPEILTKSKS